MIYLRFSKENYPYLVSKSNSLADFSFLSPAKKVRTSATTRARTDARCQENYARITREIRRASRRCNAPCGDQRMAVDDASAAPHIPFLASCAQDPPQPCSLGAATSRANLESSLRAMSRIRPIARKMRRRLTALAGVTDKRIRGRSHTNKSEEK
jgi:hypothetical protein